ncbi:MAG: Ig-like domain repeat protein, partial [Methanosphaera sp.]|nr:Ig-like domain repeat protein [Methanosphaera sp.]
TDSKINAIVLASDSNKLTNVSVTVDAKDVASQWIEVDGTWIGLGNTIGIAVRSSDNYINLTNVTIRAKDNSEPYSSIYGIDIQSGNPNNILSKNTLYNVRINASTVNSGYTYGVNAIGVANTSTSMTWINATSDNYACGLQLSGESSDNVLAGYIYAASGDVAYGAYVSNMGGNGLNNNNLSKLYLQNITGANAVGFQIEGVNGTLIGNATFVLEGQQNTLVNVTNSNNTVLYGINYNNKNDDNENSRFVNAGNVNGIQLYLNSWNSTAGKGIILENASNINISNNYFNLYNTIGGDDAVVTDNTEAILVNNTPSIRVITEENYSNFFDENGVLKEEITADILTIGSDITGKDMIINRPVNLNNGGSYVLYNTTLIFNGTWKSGTYVDLKSNVTGIIIDNVDKPAIITDLDNDYQYNLWINDSTITVSGDNVVAVNSTQVAGSSYVYLLLNRDNITVTGKNATALLFTGNQTSNTYANGVAEIRNCTIDVTAEDTSIVYDAAKENVYFTYNRITQSGANAYTIKAENYGMDTWQYNNITITADNAAAFLAQNKLSTYSEYVRYNNINITSDNPTTAVNFTNSQRVTFNYNNVTVNSDNGETPVVSVDGTSTTVTNNYIAANDLYGNDAANAASVSNNKPVDTTITAESTVVALGENTTITGIVTAGTSAVADTTLTITYGDESVECVTQEDGSFTASIKTVADTKEVTISAPLSYNGKPATETITIQTLKPNTKITIEPLTFTAGELTTITATITASDDSVVTNGRVTFKVNGKTLKDSNNKVIYVDVVDGVASAEYLVPLTMNGKELNITAIYTGSSKFNKSTESVTGSVGPSEPTFTTSDITAAAGESINLTASITDGDKIVNTGKVVFKINGKTIKDDNGKVIYAKVVNGIAKVEYTLPADMKAKEYNITAVFTSPNYDKLEDVKTLTVN